MFIMGKAGSRVILSRSLGNFWIQIIKIPYPKNTGWQNVRPNDRRRDPRSGRFFESRESFLRGLQIRPLHKKEP